jgi:hypothetical protein
MALVVFDRVKETSNTAGTGTIVLAGAVVGYQSFAVVGNANTTYYTIADQSGANWEVGIGTYYSGNVSLSRNTILASSNSNSAVTFGSNTKDVFITYPAETALYLNNSTVYAGASANVAFSNITASNSVITTGAFTNATVTTAPTQNTDVANKAYVDQKVSTGLTYHAAANVATTTTLASTTGGTVTYNQPNGAGNGVGATLTLSVALTTLDGYSLVNTDRVIVKNESNQTTNGVYTWATGGTVLTRATDADTYGSNVDQLSLNDYFYVQSGNVNKGTSWVIDGPQGTITFGTSNITFGQFSSAQIYTAGTGLTLANTTFSISNTAVTSSTYGGAANVGTFTVNAQGQLTAASNVAIQIANTQVSGLGTMSTQNANAVAITGGTINNVSLSNITYGGLGTMSTQNANNVAISGGVINNVQIGPTTANTGAFTNLSASGTFFAVSNITTTNYTGYLYGNNSAVVTASTTIPNTAITGLGTMSTQNANAVAITGGAINGTLIGNATPSSGAFTTLNASSTASFGGAVFLNSANPSLNIGSANLSTGSSVVEIGAGRTGNGYAFIDLIGDTTYTDYGLRAIRNNTGANTTSQIIHRGIGTFSLLAVEAANITFSTTNAERVRVVSGGNVGIGNTNPQSLLTVAGVIESTTGGIKFPDATIQTTAAAGALSAGNNSIIINNVNITANATIAAGQNGFSVGPVNTANGVTVTVASNSTWVVL